MPKRYIHIYMYLITVYPGKAGDVLPTGGADRREGREKKRPSRRESAAVGARWVCGSYIGTGEDES